MLINFNADEHNHVFCQLPFISGLDKCNGIYKIFNDLSSRICVLNKTEGVNLNVFNMIQ